MSELFSIILLCVDLEKSVGTFCMIYSGVKYKKYFLDDISNMVLAPCNKGG